MFPIKSAALPALAAMLAIICVCGILGPAGFAASP
jgi:hypothetical protein